MPLKSITDIIDHTKTAANFVKDIVYLSLILISITTVINVARFSAKYEVSLFDLFSFDMISFWAVIVFLSFCLTLALSFYFAFPAWSKLFHFHKGRQITFRIPDDFTAEEFKSKVVIDTIGHRNSSFLAFSLYAIFMIYLSVSIFDEEQPDSGIFLFVGAIIVILFVMKSINEYRRAIKAFQDRNNSIKTSSDDFEYGKISEQKELIGKMSIGLFVNLGLIFIIYSYTLILILSELNENHDLSSQLNNSLFSENQALFGILFVLFILPGALFLFYENFSTNWKSVFLAVALTITLLFLAYPGFNFFFVNMLKQTHTALRVVEAIFIKENGNSDIRIMDILNRETDLSSSDTDIVELKNPTIAFESRNYIYVRFKNIEDDEIQFRIGRQDIYLIIQGKLINEEDGSKK